ncbi:DUF421 domain-containing protein [Salinithrix halophila]|uniref:DUF421 domain-containing protein n=1 Tax=Salinithrix halophila TaxID=1485204 RepID=A0ABV8JM91_9BACL
MAELWITLLRTIVIYFFILVIMRLMGKREIGKLSVFDLVVSIMIAEFAVLSVEDVKVSILKGMIPIVVMFSIQVFLAYISMKSSPIRHLIEGTPTTLIKNGKIQEKNMRKLRYNVDDLMLQLRESNIANVADVEFAILETTGKLSVFERKADGAQKRVRLPIPLIIDGRVQEDGLDRIGEDRSWLSRQLQQYGYQDIHEIFFASIDDRGRLYIDLRNDE